MKARHIQLGSLFGAAACALMSTNAQAQDLNQNTVINLPVVNPETLSEADRYRLPKGDYKPVEGFKLGKDMKISNDIGIQVDNPAYAYHPLNDRTQIGLQYYRTRGATNGDVYTGAPQSQRRQEYTVTLRLNF